MDPNHLLDGTSAAIVVGGTLLGTVLRCGWRDSATAVVAAARLLRPRFKGDAMRAELAHEVELIRQDGVIRANPRRLPDAEFDSATSALLRTRSLDGLVEQHEVWRRTRLRKATAAARTLAQGADLAPVFGLAGTLIALSQLKVESLARGNFIGAIAMSVLTTLYGLLLAHIVLGPLGRAVERASQEEEEARAAVMDWLARQVGPACPDRHRVTAAAPHGGQLRHAHDPDLGTLDPGADAPDPSRDVGDDMPAEEDGAPSDEAGGEGMPGFEPPPVEEAPETLPPREQP